MQPSTDDLPRTAPEVARLGGAIGAGLAAQSAAWPEANRHAALILRHGRLVYEQYLAGEGGCYATPARTGGPADAADRCA